MQKQVNIDQVMDNFFNSVWKHINKTSVLYTNKDDLAAIEKEKEKIKNLQYELKKISQIEDSQARYKAAEAFLNVLGYQEYFVDGPVFVKPGRHTYGAFGSNRAFRHVIADFANYYAGRYGAEKQVLAAVKKWRYTISTNAFKGVVYPFLPLSYFAKQAQEKE